GPHNVAFYGDSIPKGGADALKKGMPNPMGDLTGPLLTQPNEKYDVPFAGAPAGVYKGYCMPHVALGMHVTVTVQEHAAAHWETSRPRDARPGAVRRSTSPSARRCPAPRIARESG